MRAGISSPKRGGVCGQRPAPPALQPHMTFLAPGTATDRSPHEPGEPDARPLARLKPLLDVASLGRGERELDELLDALAETIATGLGWGTVVINIYRSAWDDFQVTTVHGSES